MSIIKIYSQSGILIDYVKETLTIKKENNALINDFKVSHSTFPFLIVENKNTKLALGTREITSINKNKVVPVLVDELGVKYYGELQILSYINGFRKCNLKYGTELISIIDKKISEFMPTVSVAGESGTPTPFSEESEQILSGDEFWPTYVDYFKDKGFPTVKWNFPMMVWLNKFGVDLIETDDWYEFSNRVNYYDEDGNFVLNTCEYADLNYVIHNLNVPMPQIYLLSPLYYALLSIGFKYKGNFTSNEFVKRIMFLSFKNNLTKITPLFPEDVITLPGLSSPVLNFRESVYEFTVTSAGNYVVRYRFDEPFFTSLEDPAYKRLTISFDGIYDGYLHPKGHVAKVYEDAFVINVSETQVGKKIKIEYRAIIGTSIPDYDLSIQVESDKLFHQMHPTIPTGRYLPDWSFGTYLNEIKKLFNLELSNDDHSKALTLNFNEEFIENTLPLLVKKSFEVSSYDLPNDAAFLLKYENDEDLAIWVDKNGSETFSLQKSDFLNTIQSKFKFIPVTATANLSEDLESKDGVGLILYDTDNFPMVSSDYEDKTLAMNSIYDTYHKKWLKFRLNASVFQISGPFTEVELAKVLKTNRIYFDKQDFVVNDVQFQETSKGFFDIKMKVSTVTF